MNYTSHLGGVRCLKLFITSHQATIQGLEQGKAVWGHMQHCGLTFTITTGGGDHQHCLHHVRLIHIL